MRLLLRVYPQHHPGGCLSGAGGVAAGACLWRRYWTATQERQRMAAARRTHGYGWGSAGHPGGGCPSAPPQQLRQLGEVDRHAARLVPGQQEGGCSPPRLVLEGTGRSSGTVLIYCNKPPTEAA